jgi:hypothetical protein
MFRASFQTPMKFNESFSQLLMVSLMAAAANCMSVPIPAGG